MFHLTRRQFPDRRLNAGDLDAAADLWLAWHHRARTGSLTARVGYHRIEARLWGFPRARADALEDLLRRQAAAAGLEGANVERPDPDTLSLSTPFLDFNHACSPGQWLGLFARPEFEGLPVMLRLSLFDWRGPPQGPPLAGGTLVLAGRVEGGELLLKGVWPGGLVEEPERLYASAAWPREDAFLKALFDYRARGEVPAGWQEYFAPRPAQKRAYWAARLLIDFPGQRTVRAFLLRAAFFSVLAAGSAWLLWSRPLPRPTRTVVRAVGVASLACLVFVVGQTFQRVRAYYTRMKAALRRVYSQSLSFPEVDLEAVGAASDPAVVKYTAELEALGGRHLGDVRLEPGPEGTTYVRLFALPEDHSYVCLNLLFATRQFQLFPAKPSFLASSYFEDGRRLVSINTGGGFRKPTNPQVIARHFDVKDPAALVEGHRKELGKLLDEGLRPVRPMGRAELLARMAADHEETRERMRRLGYYTWDAAFRQAFGLVRREYRPRD